MTMTPEEKSAKVLELLEDHGKIKYEVFRLNERLAKIDKELTELAGNAAALRIVHRWSELERGLRVPSKNPVGWSVEDWINIQEMRKITEQLKTEFGIELSS